MKRNKKIIIIIILILLLAVSSFLVMEYLQQQEQKHFYDTIKNVSDKENMTDQLNENISKQSSVSNNAMINYEEKSINTTSEEILMLQDLKEQVSNSSYKEFIDIQINRLNCENRTYTIMLELSQYYEDYKNGKIGASKMSSLIEDKRGEMEEYSNKTSQYKIEADTFLSTHQDMKKKFDELGIDEDFLYNQIEEVNVDNIT